MKIVISLLLVFVLIFELTAEERSNCLRRGLVCQTSRECCYPYICSAGMVYIDQYGKWKTTCTDKPKLDESLRNNDLEDDNLRNADLGNDDIGNADLRNADLGNDDLGNADLQSADLLQNDELDNNLVSFDTGNIDDTDDKRK